MRKKVQITPDVYFSYTTLGEPNFIKVGAECADKENAISTRDWTPEQLEAMSKYIRENPECKLFSDGSGN